MSKLEGILEDILFDAVETYVDENKADILSDIRGLTAEGKTVSDALNLVVSDWLKEGDGYIYIRDDMERQTEFACGYEGDCNRIIFEYGFTNSLEAAKDAGVRLSSTDEMEVAAAVLRANLPDKAKILEEVLLHVQHLEEFRQREAGTDTKPGLPAGGDA